MERFRRVLCVIGIVFLLLSPIVYLGSEDADAAPIIGEDDDYIKAVEPGEETTFYWTVYRNSTDDFAVKISIDGFEESGKTVSPDFFILDEENTYKVVGLTVDLPLYPDGDISEGEITFSFRRLDKDEICFRMTKTARIQISGLPSGEEANTIVGGYRNPLPSPLDGPTGAFMLNLLIWFGIGMTVFFVVTPIIYKLTKETQTDLYKLMLKMIRRPLLIFIFLYGLINSLLRLRLPFELRASLFQIYSLLALAIGVYVVYQIFDGILDEISSRRGGETSPFGRILKPIFEKAGMIVIFLGGLMIGMRILGIQVTALLAGAGILGLVVAFAAQDTLSNFFSGVHLLLDRPFTIGDVLELETGEYCRVENVGMRSTKLYNIRDHEMIILPNNSIANQKIKNLAEPDKKKRVMVNVGVAYGSDIERVKKILYGVLEDNESIIEEEGFEPVVRFSGFGDSSLNFNVRFWIDDYMKQWDVASTIRNKIDHQFRKAEVTIPFPQRTVWMKNAERKD
ncbi:MAG: mechanosensitive ion channel family protein [Thermoplasmata archaeon]